MEAAGTVASVIGDSLYFTFSGTAPAAQTGDFTISVPGFTPEIQCSDANLSVTGAGSAIVGAIGGWNSGSLGLSASTNNGTIALQYFSTFAVQR